MHDDALDAAAVSLVGINGEDSLIPFFWRHGDEAWGKEERKKWV
jgi:hypothetical protein